MRNFCAGIKRARPAIHSIAIVGTNGLGKSSMLNILLKVTESIFLRLEPGEKGLVEPAAPESLEQSLVPLKFVLEGYRDLQIRAQQAEAKRASVLQAQKRSGSQENAALNAGAADEDSETETEDNDTEARLLDEPAVRWTRLRGSSAPQVPAGERLISAAGTIDADEVKTAAVPMEIDSSGAPAGKSIDWVCMQAAAPSSAASSAARQHVSDDVLEYLLPSGCVT